ncbi:2-oxoacid:ferredoxin oxidoreductase subunit beta [Syntrophus aciditrophicus]|uniref:2-oxoglutarate synthase subunit n=1 Tax=Syntrophus aciditrophicus (strain SB) TaxID=56780 RepID=Q2LW36_SYNAS|nr:2-oxoacid:ferredoxin oxidoreductase subunit beta [Syntrophus aciditrophicus]ABC78292.1 2-oxoglutarate synthase subunit [Syntrophus aciditrophicus SB]OPY18413.1 MAG: 2-oxoglutarate oxidoreductase subunit KorB [Syntrophus sp. PtaB.Bin075]
MTTEVTKLIHKYLRHDKKFPHVWCPGCGIGIILGSLIRAIDRTGLEKNDVVLVSGIGCSGRLPVYVDFNTLHTTHGRALTFATGIKLAKPRLKVIVIMGDGDAVAIGGNHFIHAARRNIDLTAIIVNNGIYGMTGGQYSPTTPYGMTSTTSRYTNIEHAFYIAELAVTAGAAFVGRGTVFHVAMLDSLMEKAFMKQGFSVVEVVSHCHTYYGKLNRMGDAVEMLKWQRDHAVPIGAAGLAPLDGEPAGYSSSRFVPWFTGPAGSASDSGRTMPPPPDKFTIGVLADRDMPAYEEEYEKIRKRAREAEEK